MKNRLNAFLDKHDKVIINILYLWQIFCAVVCVCCVIAMGRQ